MSVFDLREQNSHINNKIVAGLERLSQVFRALLWDQAKAQGLSPIQIQLLIFIKYHTEEKTTISYLAQEFQVTKPTVSDAVKVLEQKGLIEKISDHTDARSYMIRLTGSGERTVTETESFAGPLSQIIAAEKDSDKEVLWGSITRLIETLNQAGIINTQRTCTRCRHYSLRHKQAFCALLELPLYTKDIRIDCPEFTPAL